MPFPNPSVLIDVAIGCEKILFFFGGGFNQDRLIRRFMKRGVFLLRCCFSHWEASVHRDKEGKRLSYELGF